MKIRSTMVLLMVFGMMFGSGLQVARAEGTAAGNVQVQSGQTTDKAAAKAKVKHKKVKKAKAEAKKA